MVGGGSGACWERFAERVAASLFRGPALSGAASGEEAVEEQEDYGADDGYDEAAEVELEDLRLARQEFIEEPSDEGAGDAEHHGDNAAARVPSGSQKLGDYPGDQAEDYPAEYSQLCLHRRSGTVLTRICTSFCASVTLAPRPRNATWHDETLQKYAL